MTNNFPQRGVIKVTIPDTQITLRRDTSAVISPATLQLWQVV
jgi:hypothetical protein